MKLRIILWVGVISCCIALGFTQRDNLSTVWREYSSLWRDFEQSEYYLQPRRELVPKHIAATDPSAAAVAEYAASYHIKDDQRTQRLSELVLEFPDNDYFLLELAGHLAGYPELDPQIRAELAQRLVERNPAAANYHYILAKVIFDLQKNPDLNAVLAKIEQGNKCPGYDLPYKRYKEAAIDIAEKSGISRQLISRLHIAGYEGYASYNLQKNLSRRAGLAFIEGDYDAARKISDVVAAMHRRKMASGDRREICLKNLSWFSSPFSFYSWYCPESMELQLASVSPQRAKELRLQLCSEIQPYLELGRDNQPRVKTGRDDEQIATIRSFALPPTVHCARMSAAAGIALTILIVVCLFRGVEKLQKVSLSAICLAIIAWLCYFAVENIAYLLWFCGQSVCRCCLSYTTVMRPSLIGLSLIADEPLVASGFLAVPLLMILFLLLLGSTVNQRFQHWRLRILLTAVFAGIWLAVIALAAQIADGWIDTDEYAGAFAVVAIAGLVAAALTRWLGQWRISWIVPIAVLLGCIGIMTRSCRYIDLLPMIAFLLITAVIAVDNSVVRGGIKTKLSALISSGAASRGLRRRCITLILTIMIAGFVISASLSGACARFIETETMPYPALENKEYVLAEPNDTAYKLLLAKFDDPNIKSYQAIRFIGLVSPEDLPAVLNKLKDKAYVTSKEDSLMQMLYGKPMSQPIKSESADSLRDKFLIFAILSSPRDSTAILADAMENSNHERALVARAKLGDSKAKGRLEQLLFERLNGRIESNESNDAASWWDRPVHTGEILGALARLSEPNEIVEHYLAYLNSTDVCDLTEQHEFFDAITLLPSAQASRVIMAYLEKARTAVLDGTLTMYPTQHCSVLNAIKRIVGPYYDRRIAEAVFEITLLSADKCGSNNLPEVPLYFTSDSVALLKQGLAYPDERLRAWCVWQLHKVGYEFSKDELEALLADDSWKVRANAAVAAGTQAGPEVLRDKSRFVRFVASLVGGRKAN